MQLVFQSFDDNKTGRQVAREFAETNWSEPRQIAKWENDRFILEHGTRWYHLQVGYDDRAKITGWNILAGADAL